MNSLHLVKVGVLPVKKSSASNASIVHFNWLLQYFYQNCSAMIYH